MISFINIFGRGSIFYKELVQISKSIYLEQAYIQTENAFLKILTGFNS